MSMPGLYSAPSSWLVYSFSSKADEILISAPNCADLDFRYKIFKYQCQFAFSTFKLTFVQVFK